MVDRIYGVVRWFDKKRGFGFIDADSNDYFVHYQAIAGAGFKNLLAGQKVSFSVKVGDKGLIADNVFSEDTV